MGGKKQNYLPFAQACVYIQHQSLPSREGYMQWYDNNHPKQLPKYPNRAYKDEWEGWNHFLGNENVFKHAKIKWRPYNEALVYVHRLGISSEAAWLDYIKENELPGDIPKAPWYAYSEWLGWPHWLGNKPRQKVEAQRIADTAAVLFVIHRPDHPGNVFRVGIEKGGVSVIKEKQADNNFQIVKMFKLEAGYDWQAVVSRFADVWWTDERYLIISNVYQMCFEIDLEWT